MSADRGRSGGGWYSSPADDAWRAATIAPAIASAIPAASSGLGAIAAPYLG